MLILQINQNDSLTLNGSSLWRYFDIHKFLDFLRTKRFRFARMDQFEDVLEGVPFVAKEVYRKFIVEDKLARTVLGTSYQHDSTHDDLDSRIVKIIKIQQSHYVSCWFMEKRESMAMWSLYSNPESVAIKIPFEKFTEVLPAAKDIEVESYFGGKVQYQDFMAFKGLSKMRKVSLRKDISFQHEKEFRFVVKAKEVKHEIKSILSDPLNLADLDLQVVCHPQMKSWQKENIKELLELYNIGNSYRESEIRLRF